MMIKFFMAHAWIGEIIFIALAAALGLYGIQLLSRYLSPRLSTARVISNKTLLYALYRPLQAWVIVLGIYFLLSILHFHIGMARLYSVIPPAKDVALLSIVIWFFLRLLRKTEAEMIIQGEGVDIARLDMIFKLLRIVVIIAGALVLLPMLNVNISGLLALGGVGGVLVGFMAKDVLTNTVGGLMIYADQPFLKGDWIRLPDKDVEGMVEHIAWRLTAIRLFNQQLLYIPNATFMTTSIENFSRMKKRRLTIEINIPYKNPSQISKINEKCLPELEQTLRELPDTEPGQPLLIHITSLEAGSCGILVQIFVKLVERMQFQAQQERILLKIFHAVSRHGFDCTAIMQK